VFHFFTIKFHFSFFASFRFKFFASLHFSNFQFEAKGKIQVYFFALNFSLHFDLVIFALKRNKVYFLFFFSLLFALNLPLRFDLVTFASKRNKAKQNSSIFFCFFTFFCFFLLFLLNFSFAKIFSLNFRFFYLLFASDFWCLS
jgi:hypothetical protein